MCKHQEMGGKIKDMYLNINYYYFDYPRKEHKFDETIFLLRAETLNESDL